MTSGDYHHLDLDDSRIVDIDRSPGAVAVTLTRAGVRFVVRASAVREESLNRYVGEGITASHPDPKHPLDLVEVATIGRGFVEFHGSLKNEPWYVWRINAEKVEVFKRKDLGQDFLSHVPISGVRFEHNEYVRIVSGAYAGNNGSLVAVTDLRPEPKFILELESGFDVKVLQSEIQRVES